MFKAAISDPEPGQAIKNSHLGPNAWTGFFKHIPDPELGQAIQDSRLGRNLQVKTDISDTEPGEAA